jgi:hypothetical protein
MNVKQGSKEIGLWNPEVGTSDCCKLKQISKISPHILVGQFLSLVTH